MYVKIVKDGKSQSTQMEKVAYFIELGVNNLIFSDSTDSGSVM